MAMRHRSGGGGGSGSRAGAGSDGGRDDGGEWCQRQSAARGSGRRAVGLGSGGGGGGGNGCLCCDAASNCRAGAMYCTSAACLALFCVAVWLTHAALMLTASVVYVGDGPAGRPLTALPPPTHSNFMPPQVAFCVSGRPAAAISATWYAAMDTSATSTVPTPCTWVTQSGQDRLAPVSVCIGDARIQMLEADRRTAEMESELVQRRFLLDDAQVTFLLAGGPCDAESPVVLDIGAGYGAFSLLAAASGCSVIAVEPSAHHLRALAKSIAKNGLQSNVFLFNNAPATTPHMFINERPRPGVEPEDIVAPHVFGFQLDNFFLWPDRPMVVGKNRRVEPRDISAVRIDLEGYDMYALAGMMDFIAVQRPPLIVLRSTPARHCDRVRFMRWAYGLSYVFSTPEYEFSLDHLVAALSHRPAAVFDGWLVYKPTAQTADADGVILPSGAAQPVDAPADRRGMKL